MKYNLTNPDFVQSVIDAKRKKLGITVRKDKYLPGFQTPDRKYVCIEWEIFMRDEKGELVKYYE
jgi:hypothetical protein